MVIFSSLEEFNLIILEKQKWAEYLSEIKGQTFLFNDQFKRRKLFHHRVPLLFSNGVTHHIIASLIQKVISFLKHDLKSSDHRAGPKLPSISSHFVDLVSHIIIALHDK